MIDKLKGFGTAGMFNPFPVFSLKYGRAHVHSNKTADARLLSCISTTTDRGRDRSADANHYNLSLVTRCPFAQVLEDYP